VIIISCFGGKSRKGRKIVNGGGKGGLKRVFD
jgi:hypothetical protein